MAAKRRRPKQGSESKVAAIYARTSTEKQESCDTQLELCREFVERRGWSLRYQLKDEGEQGWRSDRRGYQRILNLVQQGRLDVVCCWRLDRCFRSAAEASAAEELFRESGVTIVSVTEPFDTSTAMGRFMFGMLSNWAAFETQVITERVKLGRHRMAREGRWPSGTPPLGYGLDGKLNLSKNQGEARLVQQIFRWYNDQLPIMEIARRVRARGIKGKRGAPFSHQAVHKIVRNPLYRGLLVVGDFEHKRPDLRIVQDRTWYKAQERKGRRCSDGQWERRRKEAIANVFADYQDYLDAATDLGAIEG